MGYKTNCISFLQKYGTQTQAIRIYFPGVLFPARRLYEFPVRSWLGFFCPDGSGFCIVLVPH